MNGDAALLQLLRLLKQADYRFTAVTPATHASVLARPCEQQDLREIFGWNRHFAPPDLEPGLLQCLRDSNMVEQDGDRLRSRVRVASLGEDLLLHSAFPTSEHDAVFFGPDTYRFARFVRAQRARLQLAPREVVDMGAGGGAGAITAAHLFPDARVSAVDVNPAALRLAAVNAAAAQVDIEVVEGAAMPAGSNLVIANPPYIVDTQRRAYRHGGDLLGGQIALDWTRQALDALTPEGTMLLYTGASVVNGRAPLIDALRQVCARRAEIEIEEIDPDVFGEELDQPAYAEVERIAVICATIRKT